MFEFIGMVGRTAIIAGFVATILASIAYFRSLKVAGLARYARAGFHVTTTTVFIASAALLVLILKHQFQFEYVWSYSSRDLPTGLLMSTFYAGQEGSFLLWTFFVAIVGIVLLGYTQKHENEGEVMGIYSAILAFLMLLLVVKNPFALIPDGQVPADGRGLNPLLQNFWMQIHPPILFFGFASMTPPFALAIAGLMQKKYQDWVVSSLPWVVAGAMVLGLGIALGGFWAYETLGWGGWWGWDPVENSSLIPWLVSVALVHTMLTQKRTKGLVLTNFILAVLSFVTVLYSTFLTRSGVLGDASVHSFVDPGRFAFTLLVLFMFVFTDVGFALLFSRFTAWGAKLWDRFSGMKLIGLLYLITIVPSIPVFAQVAGDLVPVFREIIDESSFMVAAVSYPLLGIAHFLNAMAYLWLPALLFKLVLVGYTLTGRLHSEKDFKSFGMLTRETLLGLGSAVVGALTLIVLLGTSLPIFPKPFIAAVNGGLEWVNGWAGTAMTLGNTVEPSFYNAMGLPLAILMSSLTALALLLKWKQNNGRDVFRKSLLPLGIAFVFCVVLFFAGDVRDPGMLLLALTAAFSFIVNVQVAYQILRGNWKFTGAYIAHVGIALLFLGIIGSGFYSQKSSIELPQGVTREAFGYRLTYTGYEPFHNGERYYFKVRVDDRDGAMLDEVNTVMFVSNYGGQEQIMRNPGIAKFLTTDLYLEPLSLTQPDPEGGERVSFTKGKRMTHGGYTVTFLDFDMNNSASSQAFTIGAAFKVEKYGQEPQEFTVTHTDGPQGETNQPGLTREGDLEILVLGMTPNPEQLSMSSVEVRLRNPKIKPDQNNLRETLVVEASLKPFISIVWIGIILMVAGFAVARSRRAKDAKQLEAPSRPDIPLGSVRTGEVALDDQPEEQPLQEETEDARVSD